MNKETYKIKSVSAREILDSRGAPTVEASVVLDAGVRGVASVPSGASTGIHEAHELRDSDKSRYNGRGVLGAVKNIREIISPAIANEYATEQRKIDGTLIALDGSEHKSRLGANAILATSLATARAAANAMGTELYRYLGTEEAKRLPVPMLNILNGGAHASNNIEIQEFMIVPKGLGSLGEAVRCASEIYHTLGKELKKKGLATTVGDEGGFAPDLKSDEEAIDLISEAIVKAGYSTDKVKIALDAASSEWFENGEYLMPKKQRKTSPDTLIKYYEALTATYPIISIEDGLAEDDFDGWSALTSALGEKIMLVGDDLFVTNTGRLSYGIERKIANAILIKPNQIGSLTETLDVISLAKKAGYGFIISHRSGETEDSFIADLAVATGARFIKTGAPCRTERTAKYNRLMAIEDMLGEDALYGDKL